MERRGVLPGDAVLGKRSLRGIGKRGYLTVYRVGYLGLRKLPHTGI